MKSLTNFTAILMIVSLIIIKTDQRLTVPVNGTSNLRSIESSDWYSQVRESITRAEYNITYNREINAYQSPNRAQNLRFIYSADGFTARPRTTRVALPVHDNPALKNSEPADMEEEVRYRDTGDWHVKMSFAEYGRNGEFAGFKGRDLSVNQSRVFVEDEGLRIEYENGEAGMRQNFIVKEKPAGNGLLRLRLNVETPLDMHVGPDAVAFTGSAAQEQMKYSSLKAWDAESKPLAACFENEGNNRLAIVVHDESAIYPVTIDPLSSTANWTARGDQRESFFGYSVSSAGDVNGDGYSDIIVGAYQYDNGQTNEGRVYVYHGSSSGLSASASWTTEVDQEYARYGYSVSTAGDVNGDGYSDVIIGATQYSNGQASEGRAYVYHGSSGGLYLMPHWTAESDQVGAFFGSRVATAGDVNGDGYSDVIIGTEYYDNGQTSEGKAFVYYGSAEGLSPVANWTTEGNQENAFWGVSVSTAGDVNGDGYSDIIIAAYAYDNDQADEGRVSVYHGSAGGLPALADWTVEGNQEDACFGYCVSTAGDVNGDGYSDVVIGAFSYDYVLTDRGRVFVYHGSANGLSATANWYAESDQAGANFGWSVSAAGDVNGDGYGDIIIGAPQYDDYDIDDGRAYVFNGSAIGLSASANWTARGYEIGAFFGHSVYTAGDVNGDGYSDVIAGAFLYNSYISDEGRVFAYHGSAGGLSLSENWKTESNQENANFGYRVSSAGDVNGDGYSDIIVGAYLYDSGQADEGKAFLYFGSANGVSISENWTAESDQENARLGIGVSGVGDVNGDGYGDVIVGVYCYSNGQVNEGRVHLYHGSAAGLSAVADWTTESDQANACLGYSVSTAGDVNGDGYSDVIVGSYGYTNGQPGEGRAFVYHGSAGGLSAGANWYAESDQENARLGIRVSTAGDVNGDGYSDVIIGAYFYDNNYADAGKAYVYYGSASGLTAGTCWTIEGDQPSACLGVSVSTAGDVNGDGYCDVIIGAPYYDNGQSNEGRSYVYYGSPSGLSLSANWIAEGEQESVSFGASAATAGDVNGDGYSDVVVGAPDYTNGQTNEGRACVYYGSASGLSASANWSAEGEQAGAHFGSSVSTAGDVNGDGFSDLVVGAYTYDNGQTDEGRVYVYYGNNGTCLRGTLQQYRTGTSAIIGPDGKTGVSGQIRFNGFAKSSYGRADGKLAYKYAANGSGFGLNADVSGVQAAYTDLGTSICGVQLNADVSSIPANKNYRWRVRTKYSPVNNPFQVYSPWRYYTTYQPASFGSFKPQDVPMPVENKDDPVAGEFMLAQNYPNPFNAVTTIEFRLAANGRVTLKIFDLLGREVGTLIDEEREAGILYKEVFDASRLTSGLYFYRLQAAKHSLVKKLILVR